MMKNKSFKYPFSRVVDGNFDHNKDGKLDFLETMQRDAQIEMDEQFRNKNTEYKPKGPRYQAVTFKNKNRKRITKSSIKAFRYCFSQ